MLLHKGKMNIE
jgi:ammonium transporter Rh